MVCSKNLSKEPEALSQDEINTQYSILAKQFNLLSVKVTPFYNKKIIEEVRHLRCKTGPLHRIAYPTLERLTIRAPGEVPDFVDDRNNMQAEQEFIIQKYDDRFLFLPVVHCFGHCQYCFRQDVLEEQKARDKKGLLEQVEIVVDYIKQRPRLQEIILTGGDPLIMPFKALKHVITRLRSSTNIESIRIHSRALVYAPQSLSTDKIRLIADEGVRLVSHITHPYEVCNEVTATISELKRYGVRLYNQFPLLRNINDHHQLLAKHIKILEELGIRTLSIFIPDPINYSAPYRITLKRLKKLIDDFKWTTPSWINSTRFVLDTHHGKVRVEDLVSYDDENRTALFRRQGKEIPYPDFPEELDIPGDLATMLWRG